MIITIEELLNSIPEDRKTPEVIQGVKNMYTLEMERMQRYIEQAEQPQAGLQPFRSAGSQLIAELWVNDLGKPKKDQVNWHLQNTSQWLYAGCILIDNNQVSTHH